MIGSIRPTGSPTVKTVTETLALLQIVGGGEKSVRKLLEEIKDIQQHNDQILGQARTAKQEAENSQAQAEETISKSDLLLKEVLVSQNNLYSEIKSSSSLLFEREERVSKQEADVKDAQTDFEHTKHDGLANIEELNNTLTIRTVAVEERETACSEKEQLLRRMFEDVKQKINALTVSVDKL